MTSLLVNGIYLHMKRTWSIGSDTIYISGLTSNEVDTIVYLNLTNITEKLDAEPDWDSLVVSCTYPVGRPHVANAWVTVTRKAKIVLFNRRGRYPRCTP